MKINNFLIITHFVLHYPIVQHYYLKRGESRLVDLFNALYCELDYPSVTIAANIKQIS